MGSSSSVGANFDTLQTRHASARASWRHVDPTWGAQPSGVPLLRDTSAAGGGLVPTPVRVPAPVLLSRLPRRAADGRAARAKLAVLLFARAPRAILSGPSFVSDGVSDGSARPTTRHWFRARPSTPAAPASVAAQDGDGRVARPTRQGLAVEQWLLRRDVGAAAGGRARRPSARPVHHPPPRPCPKRVRSGSDSSDCSGRSQ